MIKLLITTIVFIFILINFPALSNSSDKLSNLINLKEIQALNSNIDSVKIFKNNNLIYELYSNNNLLGYAYLTSNFSDSVGFSSAEFQILVYLSLEGEILDAMLLSHSEPLFLYDKSETKGGRKGIDERILFKFVSQYKNKEISKLTINIKNSDTNIDGVSSATITSILMHQSILVASNKVSRILDIRGFNSNTATLDHNTFHPLKWDDMLLDGSISNSKNYYSDDLKTIIKSKTDSNKKLFLDVYFSYANPIGIGQNIFGKTEYLKKFLRSGQDINDKGFFLATKGDFSLLVPRRCLNFKTSIDIKNCEKKGLAKTYFDRMYLEQNGVKYYFRTKDRKNFMFTRNIEDSTPRFFNEIALLFIDKPEEFNPVEASKLYIKYDAEDNKDNSIITVDYSPPKRLIIVPMLNNKIVENNLSWVDVWKPQIFNICILSVFILYCSLILYFKNWFVKRRRLYPIVRLSALIFCLMWVGWSVGAQLTIVNIFNYIQLIFVSNFNYSVIVFDPLIVIISVVTFFSFIILGRGFFCGWLCPFGALQEIINFVSQKFGIIQIKIKENFHRKLIYTKYIILLLIILFLFLDLDTALIMTEVEPFKTAITLKFVRDLPYLIYAILLLILSVFISRFYCRYVCPLGAVLAIGGKFRMINILLRKKECGNPCHLCENSCPTQAIKNNGKIDMNECFYCLDCQEEYYDVHRCPPLVSKRKEIYS